MSHALALRMTWTLTPALTEGESNQLFFGSSGDRVGGECLTRDAGFAVAFLLPTRLCGLEPVRVVCSDDLVTVAEDLHANEKVVSRAVRDQRVQFAEYLRRRRPAQSLRRRSATPERRLFLQGTNSVR